MPGNYDLWFFLEQVDPTRVRYDERPNHADDDDDAVLARKAFLAPR